MEFVRRMPEELDHERGQDGDQDQQDHNDRTGEGPAVALEPHPGDLTERTALNRPTTTGENGLRCRLGRTLRGRRVGRSSRCGLSYSLATVIVPVPVMMLVMVRGWPG